ncbi:MAG: hypothetical protein E7260_06155 [Lachnospiraceae bacterium]|nr:hypothetical protein [Lachnospiraceae bacterium]
MEIGNKKTTLSDDAALYHHQENVSEKEKWQTMSWKERWEYFKNYYLLKVLGLAVAAIAIGSLLYTMLGPKPETLFSVAIANRAMIQEQYLDVQTEFEQTIGMDAETQETIFDGGYDFEYDMYQSMQKFAIYNAGGDIDVTLMPLSVFEVYGPKGFFCQVGDKISPELYEMLKEYLVECSLVDDDGNPVEGSAAVYGIRIESTAAYAGYEAEEPVVLSVNLGTKHPDMVEKFLRYLFSLE